MGKEDELLDESALINAFDNALSNYKAMHNQGGNILSNDEEKVVNRDDEVLSVPNAESREARSSDKDGGIVATSNISVEVVGLPTSEIHQLESGDPDKTGSSINEQNIQNDQTGILDTQSLEYYNQLLARYYEIEDQRQKVLQQLSQFGYWDYQNCNDSGWNYDTVPPVTSTSEEHQAYATKGWNYDTVPPAKSASEEHQAYATQGSGSNVANTGCPYGCQLLTAPCTSFSGSGLGAESNGKIGNPTSRVEGKSIEPGMKLNLSDDTDLNAVTNAWYTAGFYTGKYLAEHKKQP